jgi:hypothetical protein
LTAVAAQTDAAPLPMRRVAGNEFVMITPGRLNAVDMSLIVR